MRFIIPKRQKLCWQHAMAKIYHTETLIYNLEYFTAFFIWLFMKQGPYFGLFKILK